jgi:LuxR family transcriptional regulator, regulator of acetate metabolism
MSTRESAVPTAPLPAEPAPTRVTAPRLALRAPRAPGAEAKVIGRARDALAGMAAARPSLLAWHERVEGDIEAVLRRAIDQELVRLRDPDPGDGIHPADRARYVAELQDVYLELCELRLRRRVESHDRAQEALERLRNIASPSTLLERVTREICAGCGFERGVLSKIEGSEWILAGAHFEEHDDWAEEFVRFGSQARPTLTPTLLEAQMARRRAPALVTDAMNNPYTHKPFVECAQVRCYVGAPIMPRGRVIGFFHADHHFSGRPVDELDRDTLWAFTAGFAYVYERAVLLERLREQRDRIEKMATSTATIVSDLCESEIGVERLDRDRALVRSRTAALAGGERENTLLLTPREIEVLSLMAAGATNAVIARELFIAEGTVKSHVKRILRKLNASNRAEAVSRYLRSKIQERNTSTLPLAS